MNKKELIAQVAEKLETTQKEASPFVDTVFGIITETLAEGGEVDIHDFAKFFVAERAARKGRNPQTGEEIDIVAKKQPKFKPRKPLNDAISN